jgi:hypothetical protein
VALCLTFSAGLRSVSQPSSEDTVIQGVDRAEMDRETNLTGYSVTEHYTLRNSRFKTGAEMVVSTVYNKGAGKSYQIVSRSGSASLQSGVFDKLLKEEADLSHGDSRAQSLITSANYKLKLIGEESLAGRPCQILELVPRTKNGHLLRGKAWVDAQDHALVRVEGKPVASPSFFTGRPQIVREYQRINGFSVALKTQATTDSLLLGKSDLVIEYSGYTVTGKSN